MTAVFATFSTASQLARTAGIAVRRLAGVVLGCAAFLAFNTSAQTATFTLDDVVAIARTRAQSQYQAPSLTVPAELANLDYDGYRDIRYNTDKAQWRAEQLPYEVNFFHVGPHGDSVRINEITTDGVRHLSYNASDFNFGKNQLQPQSWGDLNFAGFRAHAALNSPDYKDELIAFLGASYFRALGAGQRYGLSARGLAVDPAGAPQEEFPLFSEFWLQKPAPGATQLTVFALMDSPRTTGAYRFDIKPGEQTVVDVRATVFMRAGANPQVTTLGLAPLTSMFFFGENQPRLGDYRPEVHDSDGLMINTGEGEWLWRPLQNPNGPLVTSFSMKSLKGFGLMQRDRAYRSYEDPEARYELRPSAWITPMGDWGAGRVELLQFNTPDETHDNVVAYWVPEKAPQPGEGLDFGYQIAWQGKNQQQPPNGWVTQSRRGTGYSKLSEEALRQQIQYVLDFTGPALDALPEGAPVKAVVTSDANGRVIESQAWRNPANGHWRMNLRVQRIDPAQPVELRAFLQENSNTVSETWTNLVTP